MQRHEPIGTTNAPGRTTRKDEELAEAIFSGATPRELSERFGQSEWTARAIISGKRRPQIAARVNELRETFRVQTLARIETVQREALERVRRALANPDDRVALKAARQAIRDWRGPYAADRRAGAVELNVDQRGLTVSDAIRLLGERDSRNMIDRNMIDVPSTPTDAPPPPTPADCGRGHQTGIAPNATFTRRSAR